MSAAEVLAHHQPCHDGFFCTGCVWTPKSAAITDFEEFAGHQLDRLKAAGYAVVDLAQIEAFNTTSVAHGDMTPAATRVLNRIVGAVGPLDENRGQ